MAEPLGLKVVVLLIGVVTLATDVARLVLEWTPAHTRDAGETGEQAWYAQAWERRELGPPFAKKRTTPLDRSGARGPPRDLRQTEPAPSLELPPDLSIYHPAWCTACRQPTPRLDRRSFRERCSACHLLRS